MQVLENIKSRSQMQLLQTLIIFRYCNKNNFEKKTCSFHQMMEVADVIKL
jgi:hypothetical protein